MSELKVNKISPRSGTDVTLGDSGDTFTLGSGANIAGLTLSDNILFDTASKGIYLSVTSATASNLLDDYEEGTWTPNIQASGNHYGSVTYTVQLGYYTKVGRLVTAHFRVQISAYTIGSATGNINIESLPFTNTNNQNCASAIDYASNINYDLSSFNPIHVGINVKLNTVHAGLTRTKNNGTADGVPASALGSAADIQGVLIYYVD